MHPDRWLEHALTAGARAAWPLIARYNERFERPSKKPAWAPAPLLKRRERSFPPLGWPRETDSLCPQCVKEVRGDILEGRADPRVLIEERPGEVRARIEERDGIIYMTKECPKHGRTD